MGDPRVSGENGDLAHHTVSTPLAWGIRAVANLRGRGPSPVSEFSSCQVGWFAVFSGVAGKNASEPARQSAR